MLLIVKILQEKEVDMLSLFGNNLLVQVNSPDLGKCVPVNEKLSHPGKSALTEMAYRLLVLCSSKIKWHSCIDRGQGIDIFTLNKLHLQLYMQNDNQYRMKMCSNLDSFIVKQ